MQRYFSKKHISGREFTLPTDIYHHLINVMRAKPGDHFELIDLDQNILVVKLIEVTNDQATGKIIKKISQNSEMPVETIIICGISKGDKTEKIVQKGTELGAMNFIFYNSERSVARWDSRKAQKKIPRLKKIAQGAAEQAHRLKIPSVTFYDGLAAAVFAIVDAKYKIVAYEESGKKGETSQLAQVFADIQQHLGPGTGQKFKLAAFFGPEGGFSTKEIQFLNANKVLSVGMGPRIMRAETAPLYLLATLSFISELE